MLTRWLPLVLGVALLLVFAGAFAADWGESVVVRDAGGRELFRSSLPRSGEFSVEYVHSYYEVPAAEHFVAGDDEGFELVGISSPSEAVLDYYELEGRKEAADSERMRLLLEEARRFEELPLIGTEKGRRTMVVSGERVPLYGEGEPRHVTIRVEEDTFFTEVIGTAAL
jgi:hypothetical protein